MKKDMMFQFYLNNEPINTIYGVREVFLNSYGTLQLLDEDDKTIGFIEKNIIKNNTTVTSQSENKKSIIYMIKLKG